GIGASITRLRQHALQRRPPLNTFSRARQPLEKLLRQLLQTPAGMLAEALPPSSSAQQSAQLAADLLRQLGLAGQDRAAGTAPLLKDWWTGDLRPRRAADSSELPASDPADTPEPNAMPTRSARLLRRPEVRKAKEDEEDQADAGIFMVQADEPHQHAEDPLGLNRPVDRDE